jgi:hypothetical protein
LERFALSQSMRRILPWPVMVRERREKREKRETDLNED